MKTPVLLASAATAVLANAALAQTELTMWYHGAGNEVESRLINQIVTAQSDCAALKSSTI